MCSEDGSRHIGAGGGRILFTDLMRVGRAAFVVDVVGVGPVVGRRRDERAVAVHIDVRRRGTGPREIRLLPALYLVAGRGKRESTTSARGGGQQNQAPSASFTFDCTELSCDFDGSGSSDPDGSIVSFSWDFGDGNNGSGVSPSHTYGTAGTYSESQSRSAANSRTRA